MNEEIIEFQSGGNLIRVEIADTRNTGRVVNEVRRGGHSNIQATGKFEDALETVKVVANAVVDKLKSITDSPDEVEVKLGIKFTFDLNAIIAKSSTEGNLELTLKWLKTK